MAAFGPAGSCAQSQISSISAWSSKNNDAPVVLASCKGSSPLASIKDQHDDLMHSFLKWSSTQRALLEQVTEVLNSGPCDHVVKDAHGDMIRTTSPALKDAWTRQSPKNPTADSATTTPDTIITSPQITPIFGLRPSEDTTPISIGRNSEPIYSSGYSLHLAGSSNVNGLAKPSLLQKKRISIAMSGCSGTTNVSRGSDVPKRESTLRRSNGAPVVGNGREANGLGYGDPVQKKSTSMVRRPGSWEELSRRSTKLDPMWRIQLRNLAASKQFESLVAAVILLSAVSIGVQTEHNAQTLSQNNPLMVITVAEAAFLVFFIFELILRFAVEGPLAFCCAENRKWNAFDSFVVLVSILEIALSLLASAEFNLPDVALLRILRMARIMKFMRAIRVMRFFRSLRILVLSIAGAIQSLVSALILLGLLIYSFSAFFTDSAVDFVLENESRPDPNVKPDRVLMYFGSMTNSSLTMFKSMSGGLDWTEPFDVVQQMGYVEALLFLVFISFGVLAVLNVITGVFCEAARENSQKDAAHVIIEQMEKKEQLTRNIRALFEKLDTTETGMVSFVEFDSCVHEKSMQAMFEMIDLCPSDAMQIFRLLDVDESGFVDLDEFIEGCFRFRGQAKNVDMAIMRTELESLSKVVHRVLQQTRNLTSSSKSSSITALAVK